MFILKAPYPSLQTSTLLPSPTFSDQNALKATIKTFHSMNGTLYTYVIGRKGMHKLKWTFKLSRYKALELREFIKAYYDTLIKITDHNGDIWIGYLKSNPFEFLGDSIAPSMPGGEMTKVTLEFEESK